MAVGVGPGVAVAVGVAVGVGVGVGVIAVWTVRSVSQLDSARQLPRLPGSLVVTALCSRPSPLPVTVTENRTVTLAPTIRSPVQVSFPSLTSAVPWVAVTSPL